jgi:hypothetical protein
MTEVPVEKLTVCCFDDDRGYPDCVTLRVIAARSAWSDSIVKLEQCVTRGIPAIAKSKGLQPGRQNQLPVCQWRLASTAVRSWFLSDRSASYWPSPTSRK